MRVAFAGAAMLAALVDATTTPFRSSAGTLTVAPAWNGGASASLYTATTSGHQLHHQRVDPRATYSVSVTATNSAGTGPAGGAVRPAARRGPPLG